MLFRSVFSCATVRPRYSVSNTAVELRNRSVSSATEASLFAMWLLNFVIASCPNGHQPRPTGRAAHEKSSGACARSWRITSYFTHLRGFPLGERALGRCVYTRRQPAVFGLVQRTGCARPAQTGYAPPVSFSVPFFLCPVTRSVSRSTRRTESPPARRRRRGVCSARHGTHGPRHPPWRS